MERVPRRRRRQVASGTSKTRRRVTRIALVCLFVVAVAAAVAGITYAAGMWGPLSDDVQAQVRQAVVDYELAAQITRPPDLAGKKLTKADTAALEALYLRRLADYATGTALTTANDYDYRALLRSQESATRQVVGVTGKVAYWDRPWKKANGDVRVRAGVALRFKVVRWDARTARAVPQEAWMPMVTIWDFTLRQVDGVWKVADKTHWRFLDPATGQVTNGP
jgi:hypothetical protein